MNEMKQKGFLYFACLLLISGLSFSSLAKESEYDYINRYVETPQLVGEARLTVIFWKIYDAKLFASDGEFDARRPFALSLTYLRDFEGENIASRSIDEMREQGFDDEVKLAAWYQQMADVFPNVAEGENLTGIRDIDGNSHFYKDGKLVGTIKDPVFTKWFFNIWFSQNTSEPKMRKKLLNRSE